MKIGIDLLWVKPGQSGGTESYIRNLLDGFSVYDHENEYVLFVASDNAKSFAKYRKNDRMTVRVCKVKCYSPLKRYFWENFHLDIYAKKERLDVMFIPVYSKPFTYGSGIPYVCNIADLQALHYPQFFSKIMYYYMRFIWWYACRTSDEIVTISDDVKSDIGNNYPASKGKISTLYLPVITERSQMDVSVIEEKYHIRRNEYYYCVSSMLPHKNLVTILKVVAAMKKAGKQCTFVISGVGGKVEEFSKACQKLDIEDYVVQTGFVSNEERDCLYENCKLFLFPSIFEGFGMPPIEAMRRGKNVVTTKKTCIYEITEGKATYVEDPFDVDEWMDKIHQAEEMPPQTFEFEKYNLENVTRNYIKLLESANKKKHGK